ncbi:hypothetical protein MASSI9I_51018 [Massilia sp. 9I]|nr:hypothetical protein MASSI9I_51018 [Massilia sp. 9I]
MKGVCYTKSLPFSQQQRSLLAVEVVGTLGTLHQNSLQKHRNRLLLTQVVKLLFHSFHDSLKLPKTVT